MAAKKKSTNTVIWILVILGVVIVIGYVLKKSSAQLLSVVNDPATDPASASGSASEAGSSFGGSSLPSVGSATVLRNGSKAQEVKQLQKLYNDKVARPAGKTLLAEDGVFGPKTEAAVKEVTGNTTVSLDQFRNLVNFTESQSGGDIASAFGSIAGSIASGLGGGW